jgi:hypothetical protein
MRDVGQPGGGKRVLLLRGLDPRTYGDEVARRIAQEIARLLGKQGREREAEAAICRVVMIVDRVGSQSWGLSFVELIAPEVGWCRKAFTIGMVADGNSSLPPSYPSSQSHNISHMAS